MCSHLNSGKFRKQSSQQRSSLIEAIMISVDNLDETLKHRYKSLAVFLDDNSVPKKVIFILHLRRMFIIQF